MSSFNQLVIFFLSYYFIKQFVVHSLTLTELENNVRMLQITSNKVNENTSVVYIHDTVCKIYFYDTIKRGSTEKRFHKNTVSKLYTCLNCIFGKWIYHELIELVLRFLPIYHLKYTKKVNNLFETYYDQVVGILKLILANSRRFEEILSNFLYTNKYDSYFDTQLLSSLILLDLKIEFIKRLNRQSSHGSDDIVVRSLLQVLNSIQSFMNYSCEFSSSNYGVRQLFGFPKYENYTDGYNINTFLTAIKALGLESEDRCDNKKTLLLDYVSEFDLIQWKTELGPMTVADAASKVVKCDDPEHFYWYQKNVFDMVMKVLFLKLLAECTLILPNEKLSEKIVKDFKQIRSEAFDGYTNLSIDLETCFASIDTVETDVLINVINRYLETVNKIDVKRYVEKSKYTLDVFLAKTSAMFNNFKCFIRRLEFFQNENKKYYLSYKFQPIPLDTNLPTATDGSQSRYTQHMCFIFMHLYYMCVKLKIQVDINSAISNDNEFKTKDFKKFLELFYSNLLELSSVSSLVFKNFSAVKYSNIILHNIKTLTGILNKDMCFNNYNNLKRLTMSIITELNDYSLKFCPVPRFNVLFFNNMNFRHFGHTVDVKNKINANPKLFSIDHKQRLFDVNHFKKDFVDIFIYSAFLQYRDVIRISWMGERRYMEEIISFILSPAFSLFHLYAIQDVAFKFSFAVILFEADHILKNLLEKKAEDKLQDIFTEFNRIRDFSYPNVFRRIKNDVINYVDDIKVHYRSFNENIQSMFEEKQQLLTQKLEKFGIFINFEEINVHSYEKIYENISSLTKIFKQLFVM